ncbi:MAG TPA: hypothetical protein PLI98_10425 [Candidatus Hydrogenedentes bacterium]|nr:hypothetical protein [Candidatus Hydrogenedentota bacterium]
MYKSPGITSGFGAAQELKGLPGRVLAVSMEIPWALLQSQMPWEPDHVHFVDDMDLPTLEAADRDLPACDVVVGVGAGRAATSRSIWRGSGAAAWCWCPRSSRWTRR